MAGPRWLVVLGADAERDFASILKWTTETFGERQARAYKEILLAAVRSLEDGPKTVGAKARDDIRAGLMCLHVAREGRRGRYFIMFRVIDKADSRVIQVIRILHDAMDLARHVPGEDTSEPHE
jgi:toxin ParE1/3/4